MATQASCPSCGTFLTISHESTRSVVCKRCHAVLEWRNGSLRQVGNAAVVVPTRSTVAVGEDGAYRGTGFQVTGHVQLSNEDGATWDEFYLGFSDGQCGWLAQAQGRLILSFRAPLPEDVPLPDFESLSVGTSLELMPGLPAVSLVEKGLARVEAANGQVPYLLRPGETYPSADFAAMSSAFASLDYSADPPDLFVGREVTFDELGMQPRHGAAAQAETGPVAALHCTECGSPLQIHHPGRTERVTCLQCRAIFDVSSGRPVPVGSQEDAPIRPVVPVGSTARFAQGELTFIGFLQRATTDEEGTTYFWQEYLMSDGEGGYRWLVQDSDGHWSLFEPITGGSDIQPVISYGGRNYRFFQHGEARIVYLEGEFYWNAAVGQVSYTADFISPPYMLAGEFSPQDSTKGEANWTHGIYLPVAEVRRAFGTDDIPSPRRVAPNQPFGHTRIYPIWGLATLVLLIIGFLLIGTTRAEKIFPVGEKAQWQSYDVEIPPGQEAKEIEETITIKGGKNIRIMARADLQNTWVELHGVLNRKDEKDLEIQPFQIPIEQYSGVEDGERWDEGSKDKSIYLSALPPGEYTLRINVYRDKTVGRAPLQQRRDFVAVPVGNQQGPAFVRSFELRIEQGHPRWWHLFVAVGLLAIIPFIVWLVGKSFESRRWANSNVGRS